MAPVLKSLIYAIREVGTVKMAKVNGISCQDLTMWGLVPKPTGRKNNLN